MFRGHIKANSSVKATFSGDFSNDGSAAFVTSYGPVTGNPSTKSAVVVPGGIETTTMSIKGKGLYRIYVDVKSDTTDGGLLQVEVDGEPRDSGTIKGDVTWLYSVQ
jgi:hypothetical protein